MNVRVTLTMLAVACGVPAAGSAAPTSSTCEALTALTLPSARIILAESRPAGVFAPAPGAEASRDRVPDLPPMCRVTATLTPSTDSEIRIEVWLPLAGWNGKFQAVGNGGWAGSINYAAMGDAIRRGYATSSTDTGHVGGSGRFALGHPEKLVDFAYRATHEMTVAAKSTIVALYGAAPRRSYWNGCSAGGRQGLKEAERFPTDFDGIIAGDAANPTPLLNAWQIAMARTAHDNPAGYIPATKYPALHRASVAACDADDGRLDGLIAHPSSCRFDPATLACHAGEDTADCLTPPQVVTAQALMAPMRSDTGTVVGPGLPPGSELEWGSVVGVEPNAVAVDYFRYVVFSDAAWDWHTQRLPRDLDAARARDTGFIEALPDVSAYAARGGKILLYHGQSDARVPPQFTIDYLERATSHPERTGDDAVRLFLVPGLGHCRGGDGYNTFDLVSALEAWVEEGKAPERIPASRVTDGIVERAGVLCAYPRRPRYESADPARVTSVTCGP